MRDSVSFKVFCTKVEREVKERMYIHKGDVELREMTKNNNKTFTGLQCTYEGMNIAPIIYLESFYDSYVSGESMGVIVDKIVTQMLSANTDSVMFRELKRLLDNEASLDERIVYRLVNIKSNTKYLVDKPFIPYLDMAIIFAVQVSADIEGIASVIITKSLMKSLGYTVEKLYELAKVNTPKLFKYRFSSMNDILGALFSEECVSDLNSIDVPLEDDINMYVLSNSIGISGAATILYDNLLADIAEKLDSDLIILPSSVHEVIMVPKSQHPDASSYEQLKAMVQEINLTQVPSEEVLSNNVYLYDRHRNALQIIS